MFNFNGWYPIKIGNPSPAFEEAKGYPLDAFDHCAIEDLNRWVNKHVEYNADLTDSWQTPQRTFATLKGDCEDIVLLKRAALLACGFKNEDVVMLVGNDLILRELHSVLVVRQGGEWKVLDNITDNIVGLEALKSFFPLKAYIEGETWTFGRKR